MTKQITGLRDVSFMKITVLYSARYNHLIKLHAHALLKLGRKKQPLDKDYMIETMLSAINSGGHTPEGLQKIHALWDAKASADQILENFVVHYRE